MEQATDNFSGFGRQDQRQRLARLVDAGWLSEDDLILIDSATPSSHLSA